jgi:hypothetical protein
MYSLEGSYSRYGVYTQMHSGEARAGPCLRSKDLSKISSPRDRMSCDTDDRLKLFI